MKVLLLKTVYILALVVCRCRCDVQTNHTQSAGDDGGSSLQMDISRALQQEEEASRTLSRHRRYLVFPEGSSLQVVFCLTAGSFISIADIFYLGATASLAWELPQEPYSPFAHKVEALHRLDDLQGQQPLLINQKYWNEKNSWTETKKKKPHRKIIINPAFAKRSIEDDRERMHKEQSRRPHLDVGNMDKHVLEYHRRSRRTLYRKIEKLLIGMGKDGRECVLKTLCEMGQDATPRQGTFLEEIMRTVFTLPQGESFPDGKREEYDAAHNAKQDCGKLFTNCPHSLAQMPLR